MNEDASTWDPFVLLLIDVQRDFWNEEMSAAFPDYENNVGNLLQFCRQEQLDVVHLHASFKNDQSDWMARYRLLGQTPCVENTAGAETMRFALDSIAEKVITKQTFDGFQNAELQAYLQRTHKQFVLVAGLVTSVCVLFTAASAAQKGYLVAVVEDCCADKPDAHKATLDRYPFIFSRTTADQVSTKRRKWLMELAQLNTAKAQP